MAEQRRAEPVDVDDHGLLEGGQEVSLFLVDHRRRPRRGRPLGSRLIGADPGQRVELLDGPAIGVAAHEHRSSPSERSSSIVDRAAVPARRRRP